MLNSIMNIAKYSSIEDNIRPTAHTMASPPGSLFFTKYADPLPRSIPVIPAPHVTKPNKNDTLSNETEYM